jgi:hypothetical protein
LELTESALTVWWHHEKIGVRHGRTRGVDDAEEFREDDQLGPLSAVDCTSKTERRETISCKCRADR